MNAITRWFIELKVDSNGSIKKMNGHRSMFMTPFEKKFPYVHNIKFKNQDNKVILNKENKNINLDVALKNYFTHSKVSNVNRSYLDQKAFDQLQTSTLLAIWDIYRGKIKPENSNEIFDTDILIGLAKDKKRILFHYTIGLKKMFLFLCKMILTSLIHFNILINLVSHLFNTFGSTKIKYIFVDLYNLKIVINFLPLNLYNVLSRIEHPYRFHYHKK